MFCFPVYFELCRIGAEAPRCCSVESLCVVPLCKETWSILLSSPALLAFTRKSKQVTDVLPLPDLAEEAKEKPFPCSLFRGQTQHLCSHWWLHHSLPIGSSNDALVQNSRAMFINQFLYIFVLKAIGAL